MDQQLVFGPVPSRRLGKSVGINNIPPKICTYSCVYCQLGKSRPVPGERRDFFDPDIIVAQTEKKLENASDNNESIDYLTIVSDGEPTLDAGIGRLIQRLATLGIKIAVITNATLLDQARVRQDLAKADWVSVKVDTLDEKTWRKTDRPHKAIRFQNILEGITLFSKEFKGELVTETMLVNGLNHDCPSLEKTAAFIKALDPALSYLSIPTRPPAVKQVRPPKEADINQAFQIFQSRGLATEYLIGYEGNQFAFTGDIETDLLSITSVHPMREDAIMAYLKKAGGDFSAVEKLIRENKLLKSQYNQEHFYMRCLDLG